MYVVYFSNDEPFVCYSPAWQWIFSPNESVWMVPETFYND
jgi:hypothetical protein